LELPDSFLRTNPSQSQYNTQTMLLGIQAAQEILTLAIMGSNRREGYANQGTSDRRISKDKPEELFWPTKTYV
jgi:hypothetical protein